MSDEWSPYDEGKTKLNRYNHFFPMNEVFETFSHPQDLEDWLDEYCYNNYCYVWIWNRYKIKIVGDLIGVFEHLVMPIKLMSGIDPVSNDIFVRDKTHHRSKSEYKLYSILE